MQGFVAFGLTLVLVAVTIAYGLRTALMHVMLWDLQPSTQEAVSSSHFVAPAAHRWVYSGVLPSENNSPDWISVRFPEPGAPRIAITFVLGKGEGAVGMLGIVEAPTGRFQAGPTNLSIGFPLFQSVYGFVRGPALIDGVPAIWIEARSKPPRGIPNVGPKTWTGVLFAEGFDN